MAISKNLRQSNFWLICDVNHMVGHFSTIVDIQLAVSCLWPEQKAAVTESSNPVFQKTFRNASMNSRYRRYKSLDSDKLLVQAIYLEFTFSSLHFVVQIFRLLFTYHLLLLFCPLTQTPCLKYLFASEPFYLAQNYNKFCRFKAKQQ